MLYFTVQPSPPRLLRLLALLLLALAVVAATPRPVGAAASTPLVSSCTPTPGQPRSSDCTLWRPLRNRRTGAIGYTVGAIRIFKPLDQLPNAFETHAGGRVYERRHATNRTEVVQRHTASADDWHSLLELAWRPAHGVRRSRRGAYHVALRAPLVVSGCWYRFSERKCPWPQLINRTR